MGKVADICIVGLIVLAVLMILGAPIVSWFTTMAGILAGRTF